MTRDYKVSEKTEYIGEIVNRLSMYLDRGNKAKGYLRDESNATKTPMLLIFTQDELMKYWQAFHSNSSYKVEQHYLHFINLKKRMG
jgi:hypothetical protein